MRICGCPANRGNCTVEGVQNASSNPLILICDCAEGMKLHRSSMNKGLIVPY